MANLIPQLRVDRNGKAVTRHIKEDSSSQPKRSFAAPVIKRQEPELSQKEIERERPLKKVRKRKVSATGVEIAALKLADKTVPSGVVEMSDEEVYRYLSTGLNLREAVALKAIGVEAHVWSRIPEQWENEPDGVYTNRSLRFKAEAKRVEERRERYSDVAHRLELRGVPVDTAAKAMENGLHMKALSGYLNELETAELFSKVGYLANTRSTMNLLVDGVIPFDHFRAFGIRTLNLWEKNCREYRELPMELLETAQERIKNPYPGIDRTSMSEAALIKLAHSDERVLELRLPVLMWNGYRTPKDGGKFSFEEAKVVDDFIHEVRSRGITDLTESRNYVSDKSYNEIYPNSPDSYDSTYDPAKILDWHNAGLSNDQIISGMQNRWNKEQAVGVYLEQTPSSMADGIL